MLFEGDRPFTFPSILHKVRGKPQLKPFPPFQKAFYINISGEEKAIGIGVNLADKLKTSKGNERKFNPIDTTGGSFSFIHYLPQRVAEFRYQGTGISYQKNSLYKGG